MLTTGEIIRILMSEKGITVTKLAELTEIKESTITNIIYNRTTKPEYYNKVANVLNVPIDTLVKNKKQFIVNIKTYLNALQIIIDVIDTLKIQEISINILHEYIESLYQYLETNTKPEYAKVYIKGMIEGHLKFGLINAK
ncbi:MULTISPECIES: helix-turn-helix domain-containing protein [unclassified Candidatus Tisiphia]|uniref:helix-turn-helix domain-containing protein n=1 Tax=unclassified Candidatus Tisiphia TaxID=2996318 RepID=UPI00312C736A